jgi:hypothetical protein
MRRPGGFMQKLAGLLFMPVPQVPLVSIFSSVLYSLIMSIVIFTNFEKTQTTEILFFGLFVLSFVFETFRIMVPLQGIFEVSPVLLIAGTRMLIFGRLFGTLALFTSSIYAAGFNMQKQGRVITAIIIGILVVSFRLPVDGFSWDTSFTMLFAYSTMLRFTENILAVITGMSFLAASFSKGIGDYRLIALGALLVFMGRSMLSGAETWIVPFPALVILAIGTWFITARLHKVYLWL